MKNENTKWHVWKKKRCDRCGKVKFVRNWHGVSKMCDECIKVADKECQE